MISIAKVEGLIRNLRRFTGYLGEMLHDFLTTQLGDFDRFVAHVLDFRARAETR